MPGLGLWVTEESVEDLYDDLKELFPREGLCVWDPDPTAEESIFGEHWAAVCSPTVKPDGRFGLGVELSVERDWAAIVICDQHSRMGITGDGTQTDHRPYGAWLTPRVVELSKRYNATVGVDAASPAHSLADEWERLGVKVQRLSGREMAGACSTFFDAVTEHNIAIRTDPTFDRAAVGARKRMSGDVWYWARKGAADVTPIPAASIARWVAVSDNPKPAPGVVLLSDYLDDED